MKPIFTILVLGFFVLTGQTATAKLVTVEGTVIKVLDGDTIDIRLSDRDIRVRFAGIDAPEKLQEYGSVASDQLKRLIEGDVVKVQVTQKDQYGRFIGSVWRGDLNINLEMVERGHAWVYRRFTKNKTLYAAEAKARNQKMGLWASKSPVPPWEWRKQN